MVTLWNRAGHYIFALWFLYLSSSFYLIFSSPNLSRRRLDVYHTSTDDVALVRNSRWSETCCTRLAENSGCTNLPKNLKKNLLSSNISSTCPHNMANFGPLAAEIGPVVWGTQPISTGFAFWQRYCTAL